LSFPPNHTHFDEAYVAHTTVQIAEAFSSHDFASVHPYLAEDVSWQLVGGEVLSGREAVLRQCEESAAYLATVTVAFSKFRILSGEAHVVIESVADYLEAGTSSSRVASCDTYRFDGQRLIEITSYNIELSLAD
jgi:hypothetical protein